MNIELMPDDGSADPVYVKGWNDAVEVMRAEKPFGWFYELPRQTDLEVSEPGGLYLGCTGPDAENIAKRAREASDGPAFPLYAGKEGVPLSTMPELRAKLQQALEDGSAVIIGAA